ncbi:MAG: hypothetical protein ACFCGT_09830 [Sandaracinaceae bacterium]
MDRTRVARIVALDGPDGLRIQEEEVGAPALARSRSRCGRWA